MSEYAADGSVNGSSKGELYLLRIFARAGSAISSKRKLERRVATMQDAIKADAHRSFSGTAFEGVLRIFRARCSDDGDASRNDAARSRLRSALMRGLRIGIVGADGLMEARSVEDSLSFFEPFCLTLLQNAVSVETLCAHRNQKTLELILDFCGPSVPESLQEKRASKLFSSAENNVSLRVSCTYRRGYFHDFLEHDKVPAADAYILYNAGVWGYDSWAPTIRALVNARAPTIVTSYNEFEAEDDNDAIDEAVAGNGKSASSSIRWLWRPSKNPSASVVRRSAGLDSHPDRMCASNEFWQCFVGTKRES